MVIATFPGFRRIFQVWQERGNWGFLQFSYRNIRKHLKPSVPYQVWGHQNRLNLVNRFVKYAQLVEWQLAHQLTLNRPTETFAIILFNDQTDSQTFKATVQSVFAQTYPQWKLLIVDLDEESSKQILDLLNVEDDRIQAISLPNRNWTIAVNELLETIQESYLILLRNGDELAFNTLFEVAKIIRTHPEVDFIYTDEDSINSQTQQFFPWFKPGWSPEYFQSWQYTNCLHVYRTSILRTLGGFRRNFTGAEVYDLVLRLNEITKAIFHIPQVLQHRQTSSLEINKNGLSPDLLNLSFRRSLEDMLTRSTYSGWVETTPYPQVFRVRRHIVGCPLVSIIIPSAGKVISRPEGDQCLLETCIKSIRSLSTYSPYEIILVDGYDIPASVLAKVSGSNLRLVRCPEPFNFSQRINQGAAEAKGAFLVLLNDDIEVITPDWLESMLEFAQQQEIGAVGAKLLYPEGQIQHIGVTIQDSTPEHIYHGLDLHKTGYLYTAVTNRNCLAVTAACLMIRHEVFEQLDGMDEAFPLNYNDVDLCLKAYAAGYRNVVTPYAQLVHYESISRQKGLLPNEWKNLKYKWGTYLRAIKQDPYTSPNLASCIVSDDMA